MEVRKDFLQAIGPQLGAWKPAQVCSESSLRLYLTMERPTSLQPPTWQDRLGRHASKKTSCPPGGMDETILEKTCPADQLAYLNGSEGLSIPRKIAMCKTNSERAKPPVTNQCKGGEKRPPFLRPVIFRIKPCEMMGHPLPVRPTHPTRPQTSKQAHFPHASNKKALIKQILVK